MILLLGDREVVLTDTQGGKLLSKGRAVTARSWGGWIKLAFGFTVDDPIVVDVLQDAGCTGSLNDAGRLAHDGDTCPIHEG